MRQDKGVYCDPHYHVHCNHTVHLNSCLWMAWGCERKDTNYEGAQSIYRHLIHMLIVASHLLITASVQLITTSDLLITASHLLITAFHLLITASNLLSPSLTCSSLSLLPAYRRHSQRAPPRASARPRSCCRLEALRLQGRGWPRSGGPYRANTGGERGRGRGRGREEDKACIHQHGTENKHPTDPSSASNGIERE